MYRTFTVPERMAALTGDRGLGFSLRPPKWARELFTKAIKGTTIEVPTPAGVPLRVDLSDPESIRKLRELVAGTRFTVRAGPKPAPFTEQVTEAVAQIPGGWATLALGGVALFLLLSRRR